MLKKYLFKNQYSIFIIIAAILWSLDGVLRRSLYSLPPVTIVFFEHLIGALIITPFVIKSQKGSIKKILTKRVINLAIIISLFSGLLGTLFFTTALMKVNYIPFSVVILLQKLQPLFAVVTAAVLLKEKITKKYIAWAGLALVAAYFVTFPNGMANISPGSATVVAALFAVGAAAAWGSTTTFSKLLLKEVSHVQAAGLRFYMTTVFAFIAIFILGSQESMGMVGISEVYKLVAIALSTGMVALVLYYRGLQHTEAKVSTILELVFPMLAIAIDMFLYDTVLLPIQYLSAAILMYAIYRVNMLGAKSSPDKELSQG